MSDFDEPTREILNITRGTTLGRYEILERIGAGGMGEVFLARDSSLKRNVAIKFPPAHLSSSKTYTERLIREAQAAAALDHPHIVHIYEVGEHEGRSYFAMEHVTGEALNRTLREGPLSVQASITLGRRIAEALDHAHRQGVLHRDIKPANVIVDIHGRPKLVDFGLAFVPDDEPLTKQGSTLGTVGFMAPEVIKGETHTARSDLFSLGVLLYNCITGELPFKGDTEATVINAVLVGDVKWPSDTSALVPPELKNLVNTLLAPNPSDRVETAAEVAGILRGLGTESTGPRAVMASRGMPKWILAAGAVVVAVLAVVLYQNLSPDSVDPVSVARASDPKLIVLPFENLSGGERTDPMGEVMSSLIITELSATKSLSVVSHDYAQQIVNRTASGSDSKEIAREINAQWLVTGKILQKEPHLVVTSELIDPHAGTVLTAQRIQGAEGETVFDVVDRLSDLIRGDLSLENPAEDESPRQSTQSPEALAAYFQGRHAVLEFLLPEAVEHFQEAVRLDPDFALAWGGLAATLNAQGQGHRAEADSCIARAQELSDSAPRKDQLAIQAIAGEIRDEPATRLSAATELARLESQDPFYQYQLAMAHRDANQRDRYKEVLERTVEMDPNYAPAWNQLAYQYANDEEHEKSLRAINEYIRLNPDNPNPYDSRADLYARAGELDLAIDSYKKALDVNPDFLLSEMKLGQLYTFKGDFERAAGIFDNMIEENRIPGAAHRVNIMKAFLYSHMGQFKRASQHLEDIIPGLPPSYQSDAYQSSAWLSLYLKEYDSAMSTVEELLEEDPDNEEYKEIKAICLIHLGREEEARAFFKDFDPVYLVFAHLNLEDYEKVIDFYLGESIDLYGFDHWMAGRAYFGLGEPERAVEAFEKVLHRYSEDRFYFGYGPVINYDMGKAYQEAGRPKEAAEQFRLFLDLWADADPGLPDLVDAKQRLEALQATP